ncbi:hypothetical protein MTO96_001628 [Rhipicephalus appendiculatus]
MRTPAGKARSGDTGGRSGNPSREPQKPSARNNGVEHIDRNSILLFATVLRVERKKHEPSANNKSDTTPPEGDPCHPDTARRVQFNGGRGDAVLLQSGT